MLLWLTWLFINFGNICIFNYRHWYYGCANVFVRDFTNSSPWSYWHIESVWCCIWYAYCIHIGPSSGIFPCEYNKMEQGYNKICIYCFYIQILGNSTGWPYLLSLSVIPAVIQFVILPCCPRSPRYLLIKLNEEPLARQGITVSVIMHDKVWSNQIISSFLPIQISVFVLELRKLQGTYNIEQAISEMKVWSISATPDMILFYAIPN